MGREKRRRFLLGCWREFTQIFREQIGRVKQYSTPQRSVFHWFIAPVGRYASTLRFISLQSSGLRWSGTIYGRALKMRFRTMDEISSDLRSMMPETPNRRAAEVSGLAAEVTGRL